MSDWFERSWFKFDYRIVIAYTILTTNNDQNLNFDHKTNFCIDTNFAPCLFIIFNIQ